jgi:hypothetical protein
MRLTLQARPGFSFRRTVRSHGWARLAPFRLDERATTLEGVVSRSGGGAVAYRLSARPGRPAGLGLDSALRSWYARVYHGGRRVADRTIARRYASLGRWAGLAAWCEMTRDWLVEDGPSPE